MRLEKRKTPDFSYAGYQYGMEEIPQNQDEKKVTQLGIFPDTGEDLTQRVQYEIDVIGENGGGCLFFPKGRYDFNMDPNQERYLQIRHSNVVISGEEGTVFYNHNKNYNSYFPWFSPALIQVGGDLVSENKFLSPGDLEFASYLKNEGKEGDWTLTIQEDIGAKEGDCILIALSDNEDRALFSSMIAPLAPNSDWERLYRANETSSYPYQWIVELDGAEGNQLKLKQPLRVNIPIEFHPAVYRLPMLEGVGVRNIRFESAWTGGYYHHKNCIVDYAWNGVYFHRVKHGFMENLHFDNCTQPIVLFDCRNITVQDIGITGHGGHMGVRCYVHTSDCLFRRVTVDSFRTHVISLEGNSQGNVFQNMEISVPGCEVDMHGGGLPACNLCENIRGLAKISGGGGIPNLPYAGQYNTYWNCSFSPVPFQKKMNTYEANRKAKPEVVKKREKELFHAWYMSYYQNYEGTCDHHMFPQTILNGILSDREVFIDGRAEDWEDEWITVKNFGKKAEPASLYDAQLAARKRGLLNE